MLFKTKLILTAFTVMLLTVLVACNKTNNSGENGNSPSSSGGNDAATQSNSSDNMVEIIFPEDSKEYNSPVIYIEEQNEQLRIAEVNGKKTTYGIDKDPQKSSMFKPISFTTSSNLKDINILSKELYFDLQPPTHDFCYDVDFTFINNTVVLSLKKSKPQITSLTKCKFKLKSKSLKIKTNKLFFNFSFNITNKDFNLLNPKDHNMKDLIRLPVDQSQLPKSD